MMNPIKFFHSWNLNRKQKALNEEFSICGLTDDILDRQIEINKKRNELDLPDKSNIVNDEGYVQ